MIDIITCDHDPLCHGFRWQIRDENQLAKTIALTMQGHYLHAERILQDAGVARLTPNQAFQQPAIRLLTLPPNTGNTAPRWHRDGLLFQHIAWITAVVQGRGNIAASCPHMIPAHKGFDALLVPLQGRRAGASLIICEEKATTNPRQQITDEVWPSIAEIERGDRNPELNAALSAILMHYAVQNADEVLTAAHWLNQKVYRVSITTAPAHEPDARRRALFVGFDENAPGDRLRRRAETFMVDDLRSWMDQFALRVINEIRGLSHV